MKIQQNKQALALTLYVVLLAMLAPTSVAIADEAVNPGYKGSVFDRLFGKILDHHDPKDLNDDVVNKSVPFDYTERQGEDGGVGYQQANFIIVDKRTGKRNPAELKKGNAKTLDGISINLMRCWQKSVPGVLPDARALFMVSRHNATIGYSVEAQKIWLFSRHPSFSHFDTRYEIILSGCSHPSSSENNEGADNIE